MIKKRISTVAKGTLVFLLLTTFTIVEAQTNSFKLTSPDKSTLLEIGARAGKPEYRILYSGQEVITWSPLGLQGDGFTEGEKTIVKAGPQKTNRERFSWPLGEDDVITNNYNEVRFSCTAPSLSFTVITRVFDGSVAFRYELPASSPINKIQKEFTGFNFTTPYTIYQYHHESVFTPTAIDEFTTPCDLPATVTNGKWYLSIGEAENDNYTKAELKRGTTPHSLAIAFVRDSAVKVNGSFLTPWRTVSISKTAIGLHDYSQLYLKLNPPPPGGVPAWIKPGKLIRSQLNTQSALDCIDFAANHNFQYIMFDAGWYGAEFRSSSDPTQVIPQIDMPRVIQYGKGKGIGVILYVNYVGLKAKLDTILPLYKKWGIAGMKFGFVDGFTQSGITWLASAVKKVYDYGFILDVHDNYKPTGLSRTYPSFLTQEGIRGDENSPDAFHTTTLPFTRFLAGPADFTYCYPNEKNKFTKNLKVSMGQQLALTVVYFSPLQAIFWYGQPKDYTNEKEIEFFKHVPTVWNESHYLAGEIGKNISVARRKGDTWFIGNAAGLEPWQTRISLSFLTRGKNYTATIYEDDENGSIRKRILKVKKGDALPISLKEKTGQAIMVEPETKTANIIPVDRVLALAEQQYGSYIKEYPDSTLFMQSTRPDGSLGRARAGSWISGFTPGIMWYLYQFTRKDQWKKNAERWTAAMESQKDNTRTHDLGFMLYNSFGKGYELTHDSRYKEILLQGAKSLSTRFHPEVGAIRSWDNPSFTYPVIIDNLMNLEYLFWATRVSGDSSFYKIAVTHANTDLKSRFRPDNSSYHVLDFDPVTGKLLRKMTHQGYADSTCWARGQAWGIYGYTVLYRETKNKKYLQQAEKAADYFILQTNKIADHIPYWDFQAPGIPDAPRDVSAAAITASGLLELSKYSVNGKKYFQKAEEYLRNLCSEKYLAKPGTNNHFLLKHSTGHKPNNSEVDVPIIYADYYFLEALWRYQNYRTLSFNNL